MKEIKTQEEANKVISEKIEEAYKLLKECEAIADKFSCYFDFGVVYGAGASYHPKSKSEESGWQASSHSC